MCRKWAHCRTFFLSWWAEECLAKGCFKTNRIFEWMDEWMNMYERMNGWMKEWIDNWMVLDQMEWQSDQRFKTENGRAGDRDCEDQRKLEKSSHWECLKDPYSNTNKGHFYELVTPVPQCVLIVIVSCVDCSWILQTTTRRRCSPGYWLNIQADFVDYSCIKKVKKWQNLVRKRSAHS